ncbi:MAG: cobyrinate a,c-diamide synthase [Thermodesulfobacteriota bacterium]
MLHIPRFVLAGLRGGSGKTIISLGLARHFQNQNISVKPFKKGPDYIDAVWLGRAARQTATNLDPFLMSARVLQRLFQEHGQGAELCLVEGNRGLFDGLDQAGSSSTAALARQLHAPVVLILDCTKMTRTAAALVQGCQAFEPELNLAGIILNQTAGQRHQNMLRQCLEGYTNLPVLGAVPKLGQTPIPERHMGLISDQEFQAEKALQELGKVIQDCLDTSRIFSIAQECADLAPVQGKLWPRQPGAVDVNIAVVRDASLWFYYPENLEALRRSGASIQQVSLLQQEPWPEVHGLYLGGGFPETQAKELSRNQVVMELVLRLARQGLPIYAECGGLMYLCSSLTVSGEKFPMVGLFQADTELCPRPQGHGYTKSRVVGRNPFHPLDLEFCGHEFHYSQCSFPSGPPQDACLRMLRGKGLGQGIDGLTVRNSFASYTHLHALSVPTWAENFVRAAGKYKQAMQAGLPSCTDLEAE